MGVDYEMTLPVLCENPGPNVHRPLFEPPDHEKVSMAAKMTAKAERTPKAVARSLSVSPACKTRIGVSRNYYFFKKNGVGLWKNLYFEQVFILTQTEWEKIYISFDF